MESVKIAICFHENYGYCWSYISHSVLYRHREQWGVCVCIHHIATQYVNRSIENNGTNHAFHQIGNNDNCQSDPRKLPLKQRFGATFENGGFIGKKEAEPLKNNIIPNQEENWKTVHILPGVIRHTSSPDSSLAYYYKYNSS